MKNIYQNKIKTFINDILLKVNVRSDVATYVSEGLVYASLRGVDSHGIRLLPHYLSGVEGGRINSNPTYKFEKTSLSTGRLDGDHTFGHASGMEGMKRAINLAKDAGTGHVSVFNSTHFGAAAYFAHLAASEDMIGLSFTNATAHVLSTGSSKPFFGNNPICFVAPCADEEPFCLDMATSKITFNKVLQLKEQGEPIPEGTVADENGKVTTDPKEAKHLLPIGDYKGYGLSMMVDIFCSLFSGMPSGNNVSPMYGNDMSEKRNLGHYFQAIRIDCFSDPVVFKKRLSENINALRAEPRIEKDTPVMVAGDPEKIIYKTRIKEGIPVSDFEIREFRNIANSLDVKFTLC